MSGTAMPETGNIVDVLIDALHSRDRSRGRSQQTEIGPSQIGGCSRQVWHQINGDPVVNGSTLRLAAVMGTAIHGAIEEAMRRSDPFRFDLEVEVEVDGLKGHIDCYDKDTFTVTDWKTITKKKASYFPSKQQRWQVQVYGWLMTQNGHRVDRVQLVGLCRDGNENDIVAYSEDYDPAIAEEALAWLEEVRSMTEPPAPERDPVSFCRDYCDYFGEGSCLGKPAGSAVVDEPALPEDEASLVRLFVEARSHQTEISSRVDALKSALEGISGRTEDGWRVSWSERAASTVDRDAVKAALGEVPMKAGKPSLVLNVKQVAS